MKFASIQSNHGSERRMGEIMEELLRYGAAAREVLPDLRKRVLQSNGDTDFPDGPKQQRTAAVEAAIRAIEASTGQPELRTIPSIPRQ